MLTWLLSPQFLVLWVFVASTVVVHYRGKVRFRFWRQVTDHSTLMAPLNVLIYAFSAAPNRPILDAGAFPELAALRDNWEIIRDEALSLRAEGRIKAADGYDDIGFNSFFRRGWKRFYLKWYGDAPPSAAAHCPRTMALLNAIPNIKAAMFANLSPGAQLVLHRDPYAGSLRYHLGLSTPNADGCRIVIDGEPYSWRDGKDLLFDESYLHFAENTTDKDRIILFCDVERPLKSRAMAAVNRWFAAHVMREAATRNEAGEHVGWLNRAFGPLYQVRLVGKRLKAWNRRVYYLMKFVLFGGVLAAFLATAFR